MPPSPEPPPSCRREDEGDLPPAAFLFRRLPLAPCRPQRFSNWAAPTGAVARVVYVTAPAYSAPIGWGRVTSAGGEGLTSRTESHDIISKQSALTSLTGRGLHRWRLGAPGPGSHVPTQEERRDSARGAVATQSLGLSPAPTAPHPFFTAQQGRAAGWAFFRTQVILILILFWDSRTARCDKCTPITKVDLVEQHVSCPPD